MSLVFRMNPRESAGTTICGAQGRRGSADAIGVQRPRERKDHGSGEAAGTERPRGHRPTEPRGHRATGMSYGGKTQEEVERATGIEPALSVWKTEALPLSYARDVAPREATRTTIHTSGDRRHRPEQSPPPPAPSQIDNAATAGIDRGAIVSSARTVTARVSARGSPRRLRLRCRRDTADCAATRDAVHPRLRPCRHSALHRP